MTESDDTASQDLEKKDTTVPPDRGGMPSEEEASRDLPGVPEEAELQREERGDE